MSEDPERRTLLDPRYVTWEAFDRRAREVDRRMDDMARDSDMFRSNVSTELSRLSSDLGLVRVSIARLAAYAAVMALVVGAGLGPLITWLLLRH